MGDKYPKEPRYLGYTPARAAQAIGPKRRQRVRTMIKAGMGPEAVLYLKSLPGFGDMPSRFANWVIYEVNQVVSWRRLV